MPLKQYLGGSVYVELVEGMLRLTTEDGVTASNTIYLEKSVFDALVQFTQQEQIMEVF